MVNVLCLFITSVILGVSVSAHIIAARRFDVMDPFYLITGLYFLVFVWAPWEWIRIGQTDYQGVEVMEYLPIGNTVFIIGYISYVLGGFFCKKNRRRAETALLDEDEQAKVFILRYALVLLIFSLFCSLTYFRLTGRSIMMMLSFGQLGADEPVTYKNTSLLFLSCFLRSAVPAILLLFAYRKQGRVSTYLCFSVVALISLSSGSRNTAILVILSPIIYHYASTGTRPRKRTVLLGLFFLFVGVCIIGIFRQTMRAGTRIDLSVVDFDAMMKAFMYNVEIFFPFYNLTGMIPKEIPYHWGLGFLNILIQFIPHAIWENKPATLGKTAFEALYGSSFGGSAYPNLGEFYYEFGILGTIVGMFIFGYITRKLYYRMLKTGDRLQLISYSIMFGYLFQFVCRGSISSWAIDIVFMFGPIWLLKIVIPRSKEYKHSRYDSLSLIHI